MEIPEENCIVGMLLTYPISVAKVITCIWLNVFLGLYVV